MKIIKETSSTGVQVENHVPEPGDPEYQPQMVEPLVQPKDQPKGAPGAAKMLIKKIFSKWQAK